MTSVLGSLAAILLVGSLLVRLLETVRSPSVQGLSPTFAWLAVAGNCGWASYGFFAQVPLQLFPSLLGIGVFGYSLARLHREGQSQWVAALVAVPLCAVLVLLALWNPDLSGFLAGIVLIVGAVPQLYRVWSTGKTAGVAPVAWAVTSIMAALWCVYGLAASLTPVWVANLTSSLLALAVLAGWFRARRHTRPPQV